MRMVLITISRTPFNYFSSLEILGFKVIAASMITLETTGFKEVFEYPEGAV
jgi:hypothetical protein